VNRLTPRKLMRYMSNNLIDKLVIDLEKDDLYDTCITKSVIVANSNNLELEIKINKENENTIKRYKDLVGEKCITLEN